MLVDHGDDHGPFARRRRHPLDRPLADVAGGEDARAARLERIRLPDQRPVAGGDVTAGEHEAVFVEADRSGFMDQQFAKLSTVLPNSQKGTNTNWRSSRRGRRGEGQATATIP